MSQSDGKQRDQPETADEKTIRREYTLRWLVGRITDALSSNFYGTFTLSFNAGRLVNVRKEESVEIPDTIRASKNPKKST